MINGFKKEMLFYLRGWRFTILILVMIMLAVSSPLMFGMTSSLMTTMKDAIPDNEQYVRMAEMFTNFSASDMIMYNVEYVVGLGSIVILFLFKGAAGGEQKLRSVIIPQCSGLTPERYVFPKFIIYPLSIFVISVGAIYAGAGVSVLIFPGEIDMTMLAVSALCSGVFLAFSTSAQFCIGLCTGSSACAIISVIILNSIVPSLLGFFRVDRFNPFALQTIALNAATASGESGNALLAAANSVSASTDITPLNIIVSLSTAIIFSVLFCFLTIFILHSKEIHNEGDDPVL